MANKPLFKSLIGKLIPATDAINEERAPAYALSPEAQLAQYAATGCLNTTFYATADEQLARDAKLRGRLNGFDWRCELGSAWPIGDNGLPRSVARSFRRKSSS